MANLRLHRSRLIAKTNYRRWNQRQPRIWRKTSWWRRPRRANRMKPVLRLQLLKLLNLKKHRNRKQNRRSSKKTNRIRRRTRRARLDSRPLPKRVRMQLKSSHSNNNHRLNHRCRHRLSHNHRHRSRSKHSRCSNQLSLRKMPSSQPLNRSNSSHSNSNNRRSSLHRRRPRPVLRQSSNRLRWNWWRHWIQLAKICHRRRKNRLRKWFNNY